MAIKTLLNLRQESGIHTDKAVKLFEEAAKLINEITNAVNLEDDLRLREEWLKKDAEARVELKKSLEIYNQFINQLEQISKHELN